MGDAMAPTATIIVLAIASLLGPAPTDPLHSAGTPRVVKVAESVLPLPRPRPRDEERSAGDDAALAASAPLPRPRPGGVDSNTAPDVERTAGALLPRLRPERSERSPAGEEHGLPRLAPDEHAACMSRLEEAGIAAEVLEPIREEPCGMRWPLRMAEIGAGEGAIGLTPPAKVRCPVAEALAHWMEAAVQPAADEHLGGRVTGLRVAGAYVCRLRNHVPGARLSEHAVGNAIDIAAFRIDGDEWVAVGRREDEGAPDAQFLAEVRKAACNHFHTVLGPGSDAYHTDHFHLDLARRGASGTSRYCR